MSRKFAARIARNVSHARRGGMRGFDAPAGGPPPGVGEPVGGVGGPPRRCGVVFGVAMPNGNKREWVLRRRRERMRSRSPILVLQMYAAESAPTVCAR